MLFIYQESLHDAQSTKYKILLLFSLLLLIFILATSVECLRAVQFIALSV